MTLENLQENLESSLKHFIVLGNDTVYSWPTITPVQKGVAIYSLLLAGENVAKYMKEIKKWQDIYIINVTRQDLVKVHSSLFELTDYLSMRDCDMPIDDEYDNNHMLDGLIKKSVEHYVQLEKYIKDTLTIVDVMLEDSRSLKRSTDARIKRLDAMRRYYINRYWLKDERILRTRAKEDDLERLLEIIISENTVCNDNKALLALYRSREDVQKVASLMYEKRDILTEDDIIEYFRFTESERLLRFHIESKKLLVACDEYQGKLFRSKAAYEFVQLIKSAIVLYGGGFEKKKNAAFYFEALKNLGLVYGDAPATLMAAYLECEFDETVSNSSITLPLRGCNGVGFCLIDEENLRNYDLVEFTKCKDTYWRMFSIINKVLERKLDKIAPYLKHLHPAIEAKDVLEELDEEQKRRLFFVASVLRGKP
jgi:hypothetical protein